MATAQDGPSLGVRLLHPQTLWDRIVRWGVFSLSLASIVGVAFAALRFLVWPLRVLFAPVALALVVVYLLNPLVSMLERRGVRRGLGVAIIFAGFVGILGLALALIVPIIARQVGGFVEKLPDYVQEATTDINEFAERRGLDFQIDLTSQQIRDAIVGNRDTIVGFIGGVRTVASGVIHALITIVIGVILSIYILLDLPKIQRGVSSLVPEGRREELAELAERVGGVLGAFFRGQLLVALFVGVASALGLTFIAKIPFAVVVGLIAGIFNLVPLIGPFIGAIPAVFLGLLSGDPKRALWAMLVLLAIQQIDNHVISPNVMGRTVRLHPITVMLALLAGGTIAGIFGMLLVIPAIASAKIIAQHLWEKRTVREAIAEAIPDGVQPAAVTAAVGAGEDAGDTASAGETAPDGDGPEVPRARPTRRRAGRGSRGARRRPRRGSG